MAAEFGEDTTTTGFQEFLAQFRRDRGADDKAELDICRTHQCHHTWP